MDSVAAVSGGSSSSSVVGQLGSDEFLKIVLQELQSQDPLEPNDTSQMLEQLSTIMSIQSDSDMMDRLGDLVTQNELSSASGLIGRLVSGLTDDNNRVLGVVASVSKGSNGVTLRLDDGSSVKMGRVDQVFEVIDPLGKNSESDNDPSTDTDDEDAQP
jgi:flagellar basal-body rod modification protein FlgD